MTSSTLWGEALNTHDIAKILVKDHLVRTPYLGMKRNFETAADISVHFYKHGERISLHNQTGVYVYYRRILNSVECLYVGYTEESYSYRAYRWIKELERKSRHDENHPAAALARDKYGVRSTDNFYMKIIPYRTILNVYKQNNCIPVGDCHMIDEHIAFELNSLCNVHIRNDHVAQMCQIGIGA
jgi:hypothetical protein